MRMYEPPSVHAYDKWKWKFFFIVEVEVFFVVEVEVIAEVEVVVRVEVEVALTGHRRFRIFIHVAQYNTIAGIEWL